MPKRPSDMPRCERTNCFGNYCGSCRILLETFDPCPFFKTSKQYKEDRQKAKERFFEVRMKCNGTEQD